MNSPVGVESIPARDGTRLAYRLSKGNGSGNKAGSAAQGSGDPDGLMRP